MDLIAPGDKTRLEAIALVCANCHRMIERTRLSTRQMLCKSAEDVCPGGELALGQRRARLIEDQHLPCAVTSQSAFA